MKVTIIVIGDELLLGQVTDTNSGYLARTMTPYGLSVDHVITVADDAEAIAGAVAEAMASTTAVITTGGLGPTKDDITKKVLTDYFGGELVEDQETLANVKKVVEARGIKLNSLTAAQAIVPTSCTVIQNAVGTAPLMWFERDGHVLVAMPGVPFETRHMFEAEVLPRLLKHFNVPEITGHRTAIVAGLTESDLAMRLENWENSLPDNYHLAYLPRPGVVRLRIDGPEGNRLSDLHRELISVLDNYILADSDLTPAQILLKQLTQLNMHVATAESCTGGNIAHEITLIPGASTAMTGGIIAYCNNVKIQSLGVDAETLRSLGAVSIPVAEQMALGICRTLGTEVGIATSGIAGPGGATPDKPVGTVCVAVAVKGKTISTTLHLPGDRTRIIDRATTEALIMAIHALKQEDKLQ